LAPREQIYELLAGDDEGRVCRDVPESACREQPRNFLTHAATLALTKTGDGFVDPKLVLAWLLGALGAPAAATGMLVPVREALALLPQLATAGAIRRMPRRKWVWVAGSLVQGLCVLAMALVAVAMEGAAAGWTIVALVAGFALGRSLCSVSYKDVLGKTVSKGHRGTAIGSGSSVAAAAVLILGAALSTGVIPLSVTSVAVLLACGGATWIAAAALFATLPEEPGATGGGGNALQVAHEQVALLREPQLFRFIVTRSLLVGTALAPPYFMAIAGERASGGIGELGPFVLASSIASMVSAYVWGRLSDRSSRMVLVLSGLCAAAILGLVAGLSLVEPQWARTPLVLAAALFGLMIAYQGVRRGRSTHIVDMAPASQRAAYTALSNTAVGLVLVLGGGFGFVSDAIGPEAVLAIFAAMCLAGAAFAATLEEAQ